MERGRKENKDVVMHQNTSCTMMSSFLNSTTSEQPRMSFQGGAGNDVMTEQAPLYATRGSLVCISPSFVWFLPQFGIFSNNRGYPPKEEMR